MTLRRDNREPFEFAHRNVLALYEAQHFRIKLQCLSWLSTTMLVSLIFIGSRTLFNGFPLRWRDRQRSVTGPGPPNFSEIADHRSGQPHIRERHPGMSCRGIVPGT